MNEYETSFGKGCFLTLTYNNDNLPSDKSIHKDELQRFFKRLRKRVCKDFGKEHRVKYYACGEYGEKGDRPHYHAIIFGLSVMDAMIMLPDLWTLGFFKIMPVYYESCKYVCSYVMKKYNGDKAKEVYGTKQIPFRLSSQGLGKEYALKNKEQIIRNQGCILQGINKGLPKYYKTLYQRQDLADVANWCTDNDVDFTKDIREVTLHSGLYKDLTDKAKQRQQEEYDSYSRWLAETNPDSIVTNDISYYSWQKSVLKLRDLTIKAKCALYENSKRGKRL